MSKPLCIRACHRSLLAAVTANAAAATLWLDSRHCRTRFACACLAGTVCYPSTAKGQGLLSLAAAACTSIHVQLAEGYCLTQSALRDHC